MTDVAIKYISPGLLSIPAADERAYHVGLSKKQNSTVTTGNRDAGIET